MRRMADVRIKLTRTEKAGPCRSSSVTMDARGLGEGLSAPLLFAGPGSTGEGRADSTTAADTKTKKPRIPA
jgi:hypothetical protein